MTNPKILLIDDHALFRNGLSLIIQRAFVGAIVSEAASLESVLNIDTARPDLVLLDVRLQGLNGIESIALLHRRWPEIPIVMLSSDASSTTIRQAYERGAIGFVSKADNSDAIVSAIKFALTPSKNFSIIEAIPHVEPSNLTPRQCEVLNFLSQGMSNKLIGRKLNVSENTIRGHVQALLAILNATSRSEAVFMARRLGMID